jgi:tRNA-uridine 2-sulfurtransferase
MTGCSAQHCDPPPETMTHSIPSTSDQPTAVPTSARIVVAMSGGVDSAVAAALLKKAGHDVIGVTLQLYDHGVATGKKGSCCAGQDIHDARRAAEHLGIPHYVLDYEERFKNRVIDQFAASYAQGETPIPCVSCNQDIKFRDLLDMALDLGAEKLATGHYILRQETATGPALFRPADQDRDQSYFLFATTRAQLDRLIFPLGGMTKAEVRALAREFDLPVSDKPDSQDICFVPEGRYTDLLQKLKPDAISPGDIVHVDGRVLGRHTGIVNFTVGQRRGIGVSGAEPLYVIRLDAAKREVVVGPRQALDAHVLELRDVNWLGDVQLSALPAEGRELFVKLRSQHTPRPAILKRRAAAHGTNELQFDVVLPGGDAAGAPGQGCVFYDSDLPGARVLGGGFIVRRLTAQASQSAPVTVISKPAAVGPSTDQSKRTVQR